MTSTPYEQCRPCHRIEILLRCTGVAQLLVAVAGGVLMTLMGIPRTVPDWIGATLSAAVIAYSLIRGVGFMTAWREVRIKLHPVHGPVR